MTIARSDIVQDGDAGVYHCITRSVRNAFLCGYDQYSQQSYDHRREWIRARIRELAELFSVEVVAYCILSDQLDVVLRTRPDWIKDWSDEEVARRWLMFVPKFKSEDGTKAVPDKLGLRQLTRNGSKLAEVRLRLQSVSWFMRGLNEFVARKANQEDNVKGRFWEGRFKCRSLLDEPAVLTCMAHVDLLPINSGLAETIEQSVNSSLSERLETNKARGEIQDPSGETEAETDGWLCPLVDIKASAGDEGPCLSQADYLDLLKWTGGQMAGGEKQAIPEHLAQLLTGFCISTDRWVETVKDFDVLFHRVVGKRDSVKAAARTARKSWLKGLKAGQEAFSKE